MKKTSFIILTVLLINQRFLIAQESVTKINSNKIGITYSSFGENDVFRFEEPDGAASYSGDYFFTLGINFIHPLNNWLEAESGLEFSKHSIIVNPNLPPDMDNSPRKENFSLVDIPIALRANFLKYFFVNGGLFLEIDGLNNSPIDSQTGIGSQFGLAIKYDFNFGISVFVNPYTKIHSLLPFAETENHQRIWENGIRFGISYSLNTKN